ncbi:MAG: methyltransferase domain-containing protein [Candidatus Glassbacteria bacterium]
MKPGSRVLEYGCGLAPMYRTWRRYFGHISTKWVLADIPNFTMTFLQHCYSSDPAIESIHIIGPEIFGDPLSGVTGEFDLIILQEVLEHVKDPLFVLEYLSKRLTKTGRLNFDFAVSSGLALDRPQSSEIRNSTLRWIDDYLELDRPLSCGNVIGVLKKK